MLFPTMLRRKNGYLYLRKHIPESCRPAMGGRKELLVSLKTRDPELAKLRWRIVSAKIDAMLSAARRGITVPLASSLAKLTAGLDEAEREAFEYHLLSKLEADEPDAPSPTDELAPVKPVPLAPVQRARFKAYFQEPSRQGSQTNPLLSVILAKRLEDDGVVTVKTRMAWETSLSRFRTLACDGADLPVRSVTRQHMIRFADALLKVPSCRGKNAKLSAASITAEVNAIKGLLTYAVQQGWLEASPAAGLSVAKSVKGAGKTLRLPYETDEARALLDAAVALPIEPTDRGRAYEGRHAGAKHFLPMILAYSGMRLSEAGGLRCDDVKRIDGTWCFTVEENEDRRIKTEASRRVVSVHSKLIEAGLLEYIERQRAAGHDRVFHTLRPNAVGSIISVYGKFYGRWARKYVADRRKTAHSWRHTVAGRLRQAGVREDLMDELLGWTRSHRMNARYGSGFTVAQKREAIERVAY